MIFLFDSVDLRHSAVNSHETMRPVEGGKASGRVGQQRFQLCIAQCKLAFGNTPRLNIPKDQNHADDGIFVTVNGRTAVIDGDFRAVAANKDSVIGEAYDSTCFEDFVYRALDFFT